MNILIRRAEIKDAGNLIDYVKNLTSEPNIYLPFYPGEFQKTIEEEEKLLQEISNSDNSLFLLAEINGKIVGGCDCQGGKRKATRHSVVLGISVLKEFRGKGIGNDLLKESIIWAKNTDLIKRIELYVYERNIPAIKLYEKMNFILEGKRINSIFQNGKFENDLLMALYL